MQNSARLLPLPSDALAQQHQASLSGTAGDGGAAVSSTVSSAVPVGAVAGAVDAAAGKVGTAVQGTVVAVKAAVLRRLMLLRS